MCNVIVVNKPNYVLIYLSSYLHIRLLVYLSTTAQVHGAVSLAKRYGLHTLRPASILVPACPQPSCLTVITNPTSSVSTVSQETISESTLRTMEQNVSEN